MKTLKKVIRIAALILFMMLAATGIAIFGVPPTLSKERKLFADRGSVYKTNENTTEEVDKDDLLKF